MEIILRKSRINCKGKFRQDTYFKVQKLSPQDKVSNEMQKNSGNKTFLWSLTTDFKLWLNSGVQFTPQNASKLSLASVQLKINLQNIACPEITAQN